MNIFWLEAYTLVIDIILLFLWRYLPILRKWIISLVVVINMLVITTTLYMYRQQQLLVNSIDVQAVLSYNEFNNYMETLSSENIAVTYERVEKLDRYIYTINLKPTLFNCLYISTTYIIPIEK